MRFTISMSDVSASEYPLTAPQINVMFVQFSGLQMSPLAEGLELCVFQLQAMFYCTLLCLLPPNQLRSSVRG